LCMQFLLPREYFEYSRGTLFGTSITPVPLLPFCFPRFQLPFYQLRLFLLQYSSFLPPPFFLTRTAPFLLPSSGHFFGGGFKEGPLPEFLSCDFLVSLSFFPCPWGFLKVLHNDPHIRSSLGKKPMVFGGCRRTASTPLTMISSNGGKVGGPLSRTLDTVFPIALFTKPGSHPVPRSLMFPFLFFSSSVPSLFQMLAPSHQLPPHYSSLSPLPLFFIHPLRSTNSAS